MPIDKKDFRHVTRGHRGTVRTAIFLVCCVVYVSKMEQVQQKLKEWGFEEQIDIFKGRYLIIGYLILFLNGLM